MHDVRTTIARSLLIIACLGTASNAVAGAPPAVSTSSLDKVIHLVGASDGVLSTGAGDYVVTVRDLANNPIANSRSTSTSRRADPATCASPRRRWKPA
jgi:hypothetical protein